MDNLSWEETKRRVQSRANRCCEYCKTCMDTIGQSLHIEHIMPGEGNDLTNLCLACPNCNLSKGQAIRAIDPQTNQQVPIFNPRKHIWNEHFSWVENGTVIQGETPTGRATVKRLNMNREHMVVARNRWVSGGFHPPD